ncbi:unnamed protein product [Laminaria digitata]
MLAIVAEKLAVNRAVRRDLTFVDCLHLKYPRVAPRPVLADPRRLHLEDADVHFMIQEGISPMVTTLRTTQAKTVTSHGVAPGVPLDFFSMQRCHDGGAQGEG